MNHFVNILWIFLGYSSNVFGIGWLLGLIAQGLIGVGGGGGEGEPYCGYFVDIFGIGWLLGLIAQGLSGVGGGWEGEPYCRERVKCNQLSDNATTRLTSS